MSFFIRHRVGNFRHAILDEYIWVNSFPGQRKAKNFANASKLSSMSDTGSCHYSNGSLYKTKENISTKLEQSTNILNVVATVLEKFMMTLS